MAPRAYLGSLVWCGGSVRLVLTRSPGLKRSATGHLLLGQDAFLGQQRGDGAKPLLVIRRRQILLRRQPLDRIPELVQIVDTTADERAVESEHMRFPVGMEGRLVGLLAHRRKALHPADVVDPGHASSPSQPLQPAMLQPTQPPAARRRRRVPGPASCRGQPDGFPLYLMTR